MLDKVSAAMLIWKAPLMNKAVRLTTVKVVLTAKNIHLMMSLKITKWFISEVDK